MKIEIEKSEYDRLKSREEKLMAYYEWFVDKENDLATVEDIITENIKLKEENKKLKDKIEHLEFDIEAWKKLKPIWEKKEQELQRENDKLKIHIEAKDKAYMDLLTDYNYLKARIKKMEKAYLKFHDDLKKLDDKLDNDIMNR